MMIATLEGMGVVMVDDIRVIAQGAKDEFWQL